MYEYIEGEIAQLTPAQVVIDCNGVGYNVQVSLQTYSQLEGKNKARVFVHHVVREDAQLLYGFAEAYEREVFRHLIAVSGVGANTARMILSAMSPAEVRQAIAGEDVAALKAIKGIGAKSAQRIIVDLKDKITLMEGEGHMAGTAGKGSPLHEEALSALVMLGFARNAANKAVQKVLKEGPTQNLEELIKRSLKLL
jgi:Holliday junction DNA helicase RuvA